MSDAAGAECRRNSWLVALAGGVLVALMLLVVAKYAVLKALVIGAIFCVALGIFLVWAFCSKTEEPAGTRTGTAAPDPRAAATAEAKAAPSAAPSPAPARPSAAAASAPEIVAVRPAPADKPKPAAKKSAAGPATKTAARATKAPVKKAPVKTAAPAERKAASATSLDAALAKSKDDAPAATPEMLAAPRGGRADDLKQIKGIGPKLESLLNSVGVWHFDQIASWKAKDIAFVDEKMVGFHGRITRDEWVKQAKVLAAGGKTAFSDRVKKGDVY